MANMITGPGDDLEPSGDPGEPIFTLAWDCDDLLQQCLREAAESSYVETEIIEDYERRFTAWQEYLGVFAEKRVSLDRRLYKQPEIQDVVIRLLLILKRNLDQLTEVHDIASGNQESKIQHLPIQDPENLSSSVDVDLNIDEISSVITYSCEAIDEALVELSQVAVAIRQSSKNSETARARKYASENLDLTSLEMISLLALEKLYPSAPESLVFQIAQSMIDRYARLKLRAFRHEQLKVDIRSRPQVPKSLSPTVREQSLEELVAIDNTKPGNLPPPQNILTQNQSILPPKHTKNLQLAPTITSANWTQFQGNLDVLRGPRSQSGTTVVLAQKNEPPIPRFKSNQDRRCQWCFTKIGDDCIKEGRWTISGREHYCTDLEPFLCLSEECTDTVPTFSSIKKWKKHMIRHHPSWPQHIHWQPLWKCDLQNSNSFPEGYQLCHADTHPSDALFSAPNKFSAHFKTVHRKFCSDEDYAPKEGNSVEEGDSLETSRRVAHKTVLLSEDTISSIAKGSIVEHFPEANVCPLCRMKPKGMENQEYSSSGISPRVSTEMENHIAEHLQNIMILSLRLLDSQDTESYDFMPHGSMTPTESCHRSLSEFHGEGSDSSEHSSSRFGLTAEDNRETAGPIFQEPPESVPQDWSTVTNDLWRNYPGLNSDPENDSILRNIQLGQKKQRLRKSRELTVYDYTIGWIGEWFNGESVVLDEWHHDPRGLRFDSYLYEYRFGRIGKHNVVITDIQAAFGNSFTVYGIRDLIEQLQSTFPALRFWFIFDTIRSSLPIPNIRFGDIIVGQLEKTSLSGAPAPRRFRQDMISFAAPAARPDYPNLTIESIGARGSPNTLPPIAREGILKTQTLPPEVLGGEILVNMKEFQEKAAFLTHELKGPGGRGYMSLAKFPPDINSGFDTIPKNYELDIEPPNRSYFYPHYGWIGYKYEGGASRTQHSGSDNEMIIFTEFKSDDLDSQSPCLFIGGYAGPDGPEPIQLVSSPHDWTAIIPFTTTAYSKALLNNIQPADKNEHRQKAREHVETITDRLKIYPPDLGDTLNYGVEEATIKQIIPPKVQAACLGWVYHLGNTMDKIEDGDWVHKFLEDNFLVWIGCVILLRDAGSSLDMVVYLKSMLTGDKSQKTLKILSQAAMLLRQHGKRDDKPFPNSPPVYWLPRWAVAKVLQYLSPTEIITAIQNIKPFRTGLAFWNSGEIKFDGEQLSYLYSWNNYALSIAESESSTFQTPDVRDQIINDFDKQLGSLLKTTRFPLPLTNFNICWIEFQYIDPGNGDHELIWEELGTMLSSIPKIMRTIKHFCVDIANTSSEPFSERDFGIILNNEVFTACRLLHDVVSSAEELREPKNRDEEPVYDLHRAVHWITEFGTRGIESLKVIMEPDTGVIARYLAIVSHCGPDFLPKVHSRLVVPRSIKATTFATLVFTLSSGFGEARRFLRDDLKVIETLERTSDEKLRRWEKFWDDLLDFISLPQGISEVKTVDDFKKEVNKFVEDSKLGRLFPPQSTYIKNVVDKAVSLGRDPSNPLDTKDLARIALYQLVIYCDDSGSMRQGTRRDDLKDLVKRIAIVTSRVAPDGEGVEIRFINHPTAPHYSKPRLEAIDSIMAEVTWDGWTPIGTNLKEKVLEPLIYSKLRLNSNALTRPVLIYTIAGGCPEEGPMSKETRDTLKENIVECGRVLVQHGYHVDAVKFYIAQIGDDEEATTWLDDLRDAGLDDVLYCATERLDDKYRELRRTPRKLEQWLLKELISPILDAGER
ncbi:hypothetical protein TWF788_004204 [Orbilia oligospora]|uniref:VWFA domain-containing protein n=1 Tax=Orbilia oligospora TaxID=2813651 RepID=A0A7C8U6W8_ORBOL|nr:hypothetical protein TWF788_004204 [Orbilia oligospora]